MIEGVTWSLTQGVVKNIIPAIASTNAIIAGQSQCTFDVPRILMLMTAACCNEAFKIATSSAAFLNNYFMLIGTDGVYSYTFEHEKRKECPVCGGEALDLTISPDMTLEELIEMLTERQDMCVYWLINLRFPANPQSSISSQIKKPSLSTPVQQLYFQAPPQLEEATRPNLSKKVSELVAPGGMVTVTATTLPFSLDVCVTFS